ncbi:MAG: homoserine dehydrogenase [Pyrinomonadaceae bacterium]|nr:homoserine dehydrogenase [Pyrinomonadaceae bacterium]
MVMKVYNLCFLGFGNVGRSLAGLLLEKRREMRERYNIEWRITGAASRRMGWLVNVDGFDVESLLAGQSASSISQPPADVRQWLRAARADVLFETTSLEPHTGQPGIEHIRAGLESGAHIVTANKGPIVHAFEELNALAEASERRFMFEATVADCLPIFSMFRECLPMVRVLGFRAVLNSTSSIIIEEMERGHTFEEGVARAQALGVTETDPSYDVDGWDSAVKVCALARVLMRAPLKLEEVEREGIRNLDSKRVQSALAEGRPIKLVARARSLDGRVKASVRPEQVSPDDPLAMTSGTSLMVHFELDVLPGLTIMAHSPDLKSTAYGLLADFINAVNSNRDGQRLSG